MRHNNLIIYICIVFIAIACMDDDSLGYGNVDQVKNTDRIEFAVSNTKSKSNVNTRGTVVDSESDMATVGMFCAYTGNASWTNTTTFNKMTNAKFKYNEVTSKWDWDNVTDQPRWGYSSITDKYTFFAYSPYTTDTESKNGIKVNIDGLKPQIIYNVPTIYQDQPDLMIAKPRIDIYAPINAVNSNVHLEFIHTLAKVSFSIKGYDGVKIKSIQIDSILSQGTLLHTDDSKFFEWTDVKTKKSFIATIANGVLKDTTALVPNTSTEITSTEGHLFMLPQKLIEGRRVKLELANKYDVDCGTVYVKIPKNTEWLAGNQYNYDITTRTPKLLDANCYMLHPSDGISTYYIPIDYRINEFWGDYGYCNDVDNTIENGKTEGLSTEILWYDCAIKPTITLDVVNSGFAATRTAITRPISDLGGDFTHIGSSVAVKVTNVDANDIGNVVFAVKKNGKIIWSWHLWITDYDPDAVVDEWQDGVVHGSFEFYYHNGHKVEHYKDDDYSYIFDGGPANLWSTIYKDKFIMDRNLGALNNGYVADFGAGNLYYQYGRKDPFPGKGGKNYLDDSYFNVVDPNDVTIKKALNGDDNITYNPMLTYIGDKRCFSKFADHTCIWNDPKATHENSRNMYGRQKSIYDPSPLGWRLPLAGVYGAMYDDSDDSNNDYEREATYAKFYGVTVFPFTGYITNTKKNTVNNTSFYNLMNENFAYSRFGSFASNVAAFHLLISDDRVMPSIRTKRSTAIPVRCIQE